VGMLQPFLGSPITLMVAIMVLVMIVGTAMDMTPTILILTPVLMPVVKAAGIDPVYFGVMFIMNNAIGLVTPPVGVVLNVVAGVGKMSMDSVTRGVLPFMLAQFQSPPPGSSASRLADVGRRDGGDDGPRGRRLSDCGGGHGAYAAVRVTASIFCGLIGAGIQRSLAPALQEEEARQHGLRLHY